MRSYKTLIALAALTLALPFPALAADGWLKAVHAIDGRDLGAAKDFEVDIAVEGACALPNFKFGDITPYIALPADTYTVEISPADGACGNAAVLTARVRIRSDQYTTAVAHLDATGGPTASVFSDDQTAARNRFGRLTVRHAAAAPTVDISISRNDRVDNNLAFSGVSNGDQASATLKARTYFATIYPYLNGTVVVGPVEAPVAAGSNLVVYAVGSPGSGTFTLLVDVEGLEGR
jgi:hypothetical protein